MRDRYTTLDIHGPAYWLLLAALGAVVLAGLSAASIMEHQGHWITGMSNQVVWGTPHVFAILLIVAASGALNVASMGSVFAVQQYKPLGRLSALLAVALLVGGLLILVLDLGRPDRLIVAMTTFNFKSIFAWNIFLYTGFVLVAAVYLWMLFEPRMGRFAARVGLFALLWRFVLTTGTGSIFGFLVARDAYDAAIMAPLFVAMSLSLGTAAFLLVALGLYRMTGVADHDWVAGLRRLNGIFVGVVLYFVAVQLLWSAYIARDAEVVRFFLLDGGAITAVFWIGQIAIGGIAPLAIFFSPRLARTGWTALGAGLVVAGGIAQLYVIIIGGQALPLDLFPGKRETSTFFDGVVAVYTPSLPEIALGVGGVALSLLIVAVGTRVLPFIPVAAPRPTGGEA